MKKFIALEVAVQLVRSLRDLIERIARRDPALACQMRKAGSSVVLNIAEGNRRGGKDRAHFFRVSAGSAAEVDAAIDVATAWGYVDESEVTEQRALIDRQLGLLWGLTHKRA